MRRLLRYFLINLGALYLTTRIIPGLVYTGGFKSLIIGGVAFMLINLILVPLLKILLLPLNLLTLGLFAWITNVIALFALTSIVPEFKLVPFTFSGASLAGIVIPPYSLSPFLVAILASLLIGVATHFLQWLVH
jgi:putative membrane protein